MANSWTIKGKRKVEGVEQIVDIAVVKGIELHDEWMGECFLTVSVKSAEPVDFAVGDYIDYRDERYVIEYDPTVLKKARSGSYGEGFTYDNIKFVAEAQAKIVRCDFTDIVLDDNKQHYTCLPTFPFYCETVDDLLDRIQANLEELYPGEFTIIGMNTYRNAQRGNNYDEEYRKWIDPTGTPSDAVYGKVGVAETVDNINCWEALTKVHSDFALNFIVRGYTIVVGTAGMFTASKFRYGKGNGLYEIERIGDSEQQIVTRLRAYGSENNIPINYYADLHKIAYLTGNKIQWQVISGQTLYSILTNIPVSQVGIHIDLNPVTVTIGSYTCNAVLDHRYAVKNLQPDGTGWEIDDDNQTQYVMLDLNFGIDNPDAEAIFNSYVNGSKVYINSGVSVNKWPPSYVERQQDYEAFPAALVINRLMLPGFPDKSLYAWALENGWTSVDPTTGEVEKDDVHVKLSTDVTHPYIESMNTDLYGIRPGSMYFDGSGDTDEICPTIKNTGKDQIVSAEQITDSGVYTDGKIPDFSITLPDLGFDLAEEWESGAAIEMIDGMCGGRKFEIVERPKQNDNHTWTCKCKRDEDTSLHLWFPYSDFQINANGRQDHYVLTGINLPKVYVDSASARLFDAAIDALMKNHAPRFTFQPRIDEIWMQMQDDAAKAAEPPMASMHDTLKAGDIFLFKDEDLGIDGAIIIDVLTIKENGNNGIPTYEVTLRDEKQVSTIQKIQNKVDSLANGGNGVGYAGGSGGGSSMTNAQIESLISSAGEDLFLSKQTDDSANGLITFLKGIRIGLQRLFGWDSNGDITANNVTTEGKVNANDGVRTDEVRSTNYTGDSVADTGYLLSSNIMGRSKLIIDEIYVRVKAVFEALEVKKWSVTAGDEIRSCASNTINRVDYYDGNGSLLGYSYTRVPWHLNGIYFLLSHFSKGLGRKLFSTIKQIRMSLTQEQLEQVRTCRCYFLSKDGEKEVENWWKGDSEYGHDYARCQTMNLVNTNRETYTPIKRKDGNVFWWRKVVAVSTNPVELEKGKLYHYFDVAYNFLEEQRQGQTSYAAAGSDIPCAGDDAVQFGNDINPGRMNLIMSQVNGGGRFDYDTSDAPCIKFYKGIYTFDLTKCWFGGNPVKTKLSPSTGYVFYGPEFRFTTEYGVVPVPIQRGAWTDIPLETDDYSPYGQVRKCYYYDEVSHKGCTWLCSIADSAHWVDASGHYISDAAYAALTDAQKALCSRKPNYTTAEPATNSPDWTLLTEKGDSSVEIYRWYDSTYDDTNRPPTPSGQTGSVIPPQGWSKSAPNRPAEGYNLWMSNGTIDHDGLLVGTWSRPIRISGDKGTAGEDGSDMEWIYIAVSTVGGWSPNYPPNSNKDKNGTQRTAEYVATHDDFVPYGWSDNPNGISRSIPYEYACFRRKPKGKNQQWGLFSEPIMWSHWGRNGMDGDGVEYVYIRTTNEVAPELDHTQSGYDVDEYLPAIINQSACGAESNRCTDDNNGVNSTYRYEWAVIRRMSNPDPESGIRSWTKFMGANNDYKMSLWERYAVDGKSITKSSETYRYATNNTGVRPAASSSDWKTTKPTLQKGYWLYTETTITWSDGSTTVLYTDERNPNDGIAGQDIIVDGATEMKYYVGDSNTTHPAEDSSDWKDLSQVTQTQGKWLWSKATTWYKKASSASGAKDAGHSVNYNVSYISKDGGAGRGITSVSEYYKASNKSTGETAPGDDSGWTTNPNTAMASWNETNKYLWNYEKVTYSSGTTVERTTPSVIAIWTKDGAPGKGIDSIVNKYKVTNSSTPPARAHEGGTGWDDNPTAPTASNQYLWNYEIITWVNPSGTTYTPVEMIGHFGKDGNPGTDALTIDTDNDSDAFGTDSDSKIVEQQVRTTFVKMYSGTTPQTLTNLTATLYDNTGAAVSSGIAKVSTSLSTGEVSVTFYSGATVYANSIYAQITATCAKGTLSTKFTMQKVKSGAPGVSPTIYQLYPTSTAFTFDRDVNNNLVAKVNTSTIKVKKTVGNTTTIETSAPGYTYRYGFDDSSAYASNQAINSAITVSTTQADSYSSVWVELMNGSTVVDRETLPILKEGSKGESGVNVVASPASLIINQNIDNPSSLSSLTETIGIAVYKGDVAQTVNSITFDAHGRLTLLKNGGSTGSSGTISGGTLTIKSVATSGGVYYDTATIDCTVTYNTNKTVTVAIRVYVNLLGTWKQSVEDGTETSIAKKLSYEIFDDQVHTIDQTGEYIRGWGENTSKLQKTVGRNMLDCADGAGWRYFGSNEPADYNASNQRVLPESGQSTVDAFTSSVWLESGTTYTFSVYTPSSPSFRWRKVDSPEQAGKEGTQYSVTVVSAGSGRYYCTFAPTASGYYKMNVWGVSYLEKAQLEVGSAPTAWESTKSYGSEIKQTAEEIKLSVKDDLGETGIDITNHKIEMQADDFVLKNSGGSQIVGVNANGDFEVSGTIKATNFYHHVCYYFGGGVCLNGGEKYYKGGLQYNTSGYADIIEIKQSYNGNWSWTGDSKNNYTILLPDPSTCEGKIVTVYCGVVYCTGRIALGCIGTNKMVTRWSVSNGVLVPESLSGDQPIDAVDLQAGRYIEGYRLSNGWSGSRTVDVDLFEPVVYAFAAQKSGSVYYWFQVK